MKDFRALIDMWPSLGDFATDVNLAYVTAKQMRRRNSIAPGHWPKVVAAAKRRRIDGISIEKLGTLAVQRAA